MPLAQKQKIFHPQSSKMSKLRYEYLNKNANILVPKNWIVELMQVILQNPIPIDLQSLIFSQIFHIYFQQL